MSAEHALEALLFSSGRAMDEELLAQLVEQEPRAVREALKAVKQRYDEQGSAVTLFNDGSLWKMQVREQHIPLVRRIVADTELSRATLETLAVIAFEHPKALQSKVVEVRGSNAYEQIKELEKLGFVTRSKEGRSYSLRLTEKFFEYFDVEGEQIRSVFKDVRIPEPAERQEVLGMEVVDADEESADELVEAPRKTIERDREAESAFLAQMEEKLTTVSQRNDALEQDDSFKPLEREDAPEETMAEDPDGALDDAGVKDV